MDRSHTDVGRSWCCGCSVPTPQHLSLKLKARPKTPLTEDVLFWPQEQAGFGYRANVSARDLNVVMALN